MYLDKMNCPKEFNGSIVYTPPGHVPVDPAPRQSGGRA